MSRRQQRRRTSRRRAHAVVAAGGIAVAATLSTGGVAQAAPQTFTVTNLGDCATLGCGSLREAAAQVSADSTDTVPPGDAIVFASGLSGTISLTGSELYIKNPVQLIGPGANVVTIHAAPGSRVLDLKQGGMVSALTLSGGAPSSGPGGGIYSTNQPLELDAVVLTGNSASQGGGVDTFYSPLTVNDSTISGNHATLKGGGGVFSLDDLATVNNSTISGNDAPVKGGGVYAWSGLIINDSTITGNTSLVGAGVYWYGPSNFTGSTVAANTPTKASGGQLEGYDPLRLYDSIVAGSGTVPDIAVAPGASIHASFSLIRHAAVPAGDTPITTDSSDLTGKDPQLGALANNGGPTETMKPGPASPAIDQGKSFGLTTDQRGFARSVSCPGVTRSTAAGADGSDIGAVELQASECPPVVGGGGGKTKPSCTLTPLTNKVVIAKKKKSSKSALSVSIVCDQSATLSLEGKIKADFKKHGEHKQKRKTFTLSAVPGSAVAGQGLTLKIKVSNAALKALEAGASESVAFKLTDTNANGSNQTTATIKHLKLVRAK